MRNTIKTLAAILIVLSAAKSNASTDTTAVGTFCKVVAQEKENSYELIYQGNKKANVLIQWMDNDSHILHSENLKSTERFVKRYDLATLPHGEYTVKVVAQDYEFSKEVILGEEAAVKVFLKNLGDNKIVLTGYPVKAADFSIVVLNDQSEKIYEQTIKNASVIQKKYVIDQVDTKSVTFVIYSNNKIISEQTITL
jgi:hypothetical protein